MRRLERNGEYPQVSLCMGRKVLWLGVQTAFSEAGKSPPVRAGLSRLSGKQTVQNHGHGYGGLPLRLWICRPCPVQSA